LYYYLYKFLSILIIFSLKIYKKDEWSNILLKNLLSDCENENVSEMTKIASLKAIGNIGYANNINIITNCAANSNLSIELRVDAIQSLENFDCNSMEETNKIYELLQNVNEDVEIRINSFLSIMRCSDNSETFQLFAQNNLENFLLKENDQQVTLYFFYYILA
jgi:hypothetical protein